MDCGKTLAKPHGADFSWIANSGRNAMKKGGGGGLS